MPSSIIRKSDGFSPFTYLPLLSVTVKPRTTMSTFARKVGRLVSCAKALRPANIAAAPMPKTFRLDVTRLSLACLL